MTSLLLTECVYCLKVCAATQKKSLAGLDNIATDGTSSIHTLHQVVEKLAEAGKIYSFVLEEVTMHTQHPTRNKQQTFNKANVQLEL